MSNYLGDFSTNASINFKFTTINSSAGKPTSLSGGTLKIYRAGTTVGSSAGITLTANHLATTGLNHIKVNTSANSFYTASNDYHTYLTGGTVNSVTVKGYTVGQFSLRNRSGLMPAVAGRTLQVSTDNRASVNILEIKSSTANADNLVSRIDATISSRMSSTKSVLGSTAVANANVTKIKGSTAINDLFFNFFNEGYSENLDAAITTRTASSIWTGTKAGYLDTAISSRMSSTKVPDSNIIKIKGTTANTDNLVIRIDNTISSRMSSTKTIPPSTSGNVTQIKGSTLSADKLVNNLNAYTTPRAVKLDYLDVVVSSRMSSTKTVATSTTLMNANLTKIKGTTSNADNLVSRIDTTISSRMSSTKTVLTSTSVVSSNVTKIKSSTQNADNLVNRVDTAISSRLATTNPKVVALTTDRIDNLDNLNAQISSRFATTGVATANITKIKGSSVNADNLVTRIDAAISSRMSSTKSVMSSTKSVLGSTAIALANIKQIKGTTSNTDNLVSRVDATISSRMSSTKTVLTSTSVVSSNLTKVKGSTSTIDNWVTRIDDEITSRLGTTNAKTVALTTGRISKLDYLDIAVSSRMSSTKNVSSTASNITKIKGTTANADKLVNNLNAYTTGKSAYLDATISSRMSSTKSVLGSTAVANANLTKIKGSSVNADNLVSRIDAAITSRMSSTKSVLGSTQIATANITKIKGTTANADNIVNRIDVAISSRMSSTKTIPPSTSGNVTQIKGSTLSADKLVNNLNAYTTLRAIKLDYLDVAITSRMSSTKTIPPSTSGNVSQIKGSTLNADKLVNNLNAYTTGRAVKLDNLDTLVSSRLSSTNALNVNLTKIKGTTSNADNLVSRVDATISSRMSSTKSVLGSTATANANLIKIKGSSANTDNLVSRVDIAISSRMSSTKIVATSTTLMNANLTKIKGTTSNIDNLVNRLDATISSRLATTNAKIVALTTDRIDNLDNLNTQISSRLATTGVATANITKIKGSTINVDNLVTRIDALISSRMSSTKAIMSSTKSVLGSTQIALANLKQVKNSTATADNWVSRIDTLISSRMSSTKTVLTSTAIVSSNLTKVKGSTITVDSWVARIDDEITSRLGTTNAKIVALTTERVSKLDNLDVAVNSRMSSTKSVLGSTMVALANIKQIKGSTANTDNLVSRIDIAVSSRLPTTNAKIVALTTGRISSLDNLDAAITSRLKSTGAIGSLGIQAKADVNTEVVDVIRTDSSTETSALGATLSGKIDNIWGRFFRKVTQSSTTQKVYKADNATVIGSMTVSETTALQTKGKASS